MPLFFFLHRYPPCIRYFYSNIVYYRFSICNIFTAILISFFKNIKKAVTNFVIFLLYAGNDVAHTFCAPIKKLPTDNP
ncbi:hypothetical protein HMPREF3033_01372 [Veillonellaceae bacterium DNF00751]|nr:hypothetical protein HMPREF3033_01372 [Veillonellaceae bacterium DNF00751]